MYSDLFIDSSVSLFISISTTLYIFVYIGRRWTYHESNVSGWYDPRTVRKRWKPQADL